MVLINKVLEGCGGFAIAYMDDILVYSPDEKNSSETPGNHIHETEESKTENKNQYVQLS